MASTRTNKPTAAGRSRAGRRTGTWIVYIVECADRSLYTGITTDLARRLDAHRRGTGAKYMRRRGPFILRYRERHRTRSAALVREAAIKSLARAAKLALIARRRA
jgi:putative endonuclease